MSTNRFKFTKPLLSNIVAPEKGRTVYYDTEVKKLALRVSASGSKIFYVVKRVGKAIEWLRLGSFIDMTVEQARKAAEKELGNFANGNNPAEAKRTEKATMTLGEAFERYIREYAKPHGVRGIEDMRAMWERCLGELPDEPAKKHGRKRSKHPAGANWQNRKLDSIDNADVNALHSAIGATHKTMANRIVELLSAIYNRAIKWGYKGENPTKDVERFSSNERDRFMQPKEFPKFLEALAVDSSESFKAFVLLSLLTGARRENVLGMRWEQIGFDRRVWGIPSNTSKNGEPITIPLSGEALAILESRKGISDSEFVFPAVSKSGYMTPPKKRWAALLKRAGLNDLHIHDLRRTMGSWQAITGASLIVIGKSLGHKSVDATKIYARLHIDPVRDSMEKATAAMMNFGAIKPAFEMLSCHDKK